MATKNMGYGSLCNTGRLHAPLFFNVCTEVLAAPVVRDKLVLNITDGLRAQYDGGPDKNAQFVYDNHSLYFATDPFALDMICHRQMIAKRKAMGDHRQREPALHRVPALRGDSSGWASRRRRRSITCWRPGASAWALAPGIRAGVAQGVSPAGDGRPDWS